MTNNINNTADNDENLSNKDALKKLIVLSYVLPESKVQGTDMFGRTSIRAQFNSIDSKIDALMKDMPSEEVQLAQEEANDVIREMMDDEDGLNTNRMVDDLASRFEAHDKEERNGDYAFNQHLAVIRSAWKTADEAQLRHERMAMRLAIMDELKRKRQDDKALLLNDDLVQRVMDGEGDFDNEVKNFVVEKNQMLAKEREILKKNNSVYFRLILEHKANVLCTMSYTAEQLKKKKFRTDDDFQFIQMVIKHANTIKAWCEKKEKRPAPYSKRAIWALYNECIDTLHALGVYNQTFYRTEFGTKDPCSFRVVPTASTMVEVKSGADWSEEIASVFYEASDGCSRTPIRGSDG